MAAKRDEKVKSLRIIEIDKIIRSGKYPNATTLRKHFEVSRATIMRDLDFLRDRYQAPLEYDYQKNGFYYTDPTFFIQSVMLSEGELFTVATIMPLLDQYKNTPLENSFRNILEKMTSMLPNEISVDTSLLDHEFSFISDPLPTIDEEVFNSVFQSLRQKRSLEFDYRTISSQEYKHRQIDPYHVICTKGNWYTIAFSKDKNEIRVYALSRMKNTKTTAESFTVPEDFKLSDHIDPAFGIWTTKDAPMQIELLFDSSVNTLILERKWHATQKIQQLQDGSVKLSFTTNQFQETFQWVMSFGGAVKVLNPPELADKICTELKKMLQLYK